MERKVFVIVGAPCSGKTTMMQTLSKYLEGESFSVIETGEIFRNDEKLREITARGELVDDQTVIEIFKKEMEKAEGIIFLNGYPRTKIQAVKLDEFLKENNTKIDYVLYLDVEEKIILDRILKRRICSNDACREIYNLEFKKPSKENVCDKCGSKLIQRPDDNEEVFKERLEVYKKASPEIIDYYKETGVLVTEQITLENHKTSNDVAREFVEFAKKNK